MPKSSKSGRLERKSDVKAKPPQKPKKVLKQKPRERQKLPTGMLSESRKDKMPKKLLSPLPKLKKMKKAVLKKVKKK